MGQYKQWLHYRAADQQLQTQLETLESELAQLQEPAQPVEQCESPLQDAVSSPAQSPEDAAFEHSGLTTNKIILSLAASLDGQISSPLDEYTSTQVPTNRQVPPLGQPAETISSALFAWSNLPNFEASNLPAEPSIPSTSTIPNFDQLLPHIPHQELVLLPEDMSSFIDEHSLTDPRVEMPWWLHNIAVASGANNSNGGPIDQERIRTNRLIQRWLERWGYQPSSQDAKGENYHE